MYAYVHVDASLCGPGRNLPFCGGWAARLTSSDDDREHLSSGTLPGMAMQTVNMAEAFAVVAGVRFAKQVYPEAVEVVVYTDSTSVQKSLHRPLRVLKNEKSKYRPYRFAIRRFAGTSRVSIEAMPRSADEINLVHTCAKERMRRVRTRLVDAC